MHNYSVARLHYWLIVNVKTWENLLTFCMKSWQTFTQFSVVKIISSRNYGWGTDQPNGREFLGPDFLLVSINYDDRISHGVMHDLQEVFSRKFGPLARGCLACACAGASCGLGLIKSLRPCCLALAAWTTPTQYVVTYSVLTTYGT